MYPSLLSPPSLFPAAWLERQPIKSTSHFTSLHLVEFRRMTPQGGTAPVSYAGNWKNQKFTPGAERLAWILKRYQSIYQILRKTRVLAILVEVNLVRPSCFCSLFSILFAVIIKFPRTARQHRDIWSGIWWSWQFAADYLSSLCKVGERSGKKEP